MKRVALPLGLVLSLASSLGPLACSDAREGGGGERDEATTATAFEFAANETDDASEAEAEAPSGDTYADVLPVGAFADVATLCAKQKELVVPSLAVAKQASSDRGWGGEPDLVPSCEESAEALSIARVALGGSYLDARAVTVEIGSSTATFLALRTAAGWTFVRRALLDQRHDDPGCGSIERTTDIAEVRLERDAVVVVTHAGRTGYAGDEGGELYLTYAQACRVAGDGQAATCGASEVVAARRAVVSPDDLDAAPSTKSTFATPYGVDPAGTGITVGRRFDEERD